MNQTLPLKDREPLGELRSPEGRAAFADFMPSICRREPAVVNAMGTGVRDVRHLPTSYPWAGTIVADTFFGHTRKPGRLAGMTNGDDNWNGATDNVATVIEKG